MAGPTRLELATSGVTVRCLHLTKTYQIVKNKPFEAGFRTGRITKSYQYLPSQPETKRKHLEGAIKLRRCANKCANP